MLDLGAFKNSGTINATGAGVNVFSGSGGVINSGTITATGTALTIFGATLNNSGTIRSTGGTGFVGSGSSGVVANNSGRIEGQNYGASIRLALNNTGTIIGGTGGVLLQTFGSVYNKAGGTISGGAYSIDGRSASFNSYVYNAGTLSGNVALTGFTLTSPNIFVALPGGILDGNLSLNSSILVTDLVGSGSGRFAGISGTVSAANSQLRYRVSSDIAATMAAPPTGFISTGYELSKGATLTLTGSSTQSRQLEVAGQGNVDLNAAISVTTTPAILATSATVIPGITSAPNALSITSLGPITLTRANDSYPYAAVVLGSADNFTNLGTITVTDRTAYPGTSAIGGGATVTNNGVIRLDGATGVANATSVINLGTISQIAGGAASQGVIVGKSLENRGTISVGGIAVRSDQYFYGAQTMVNGGTIASSGNVAILGNNRFALTNLTGGTISGGGTLPAIRASGGMFTNSGSAAGDVDLGYSDYGRSFSTATYVAAGGTIAGSLKFGSGDDLLLQTGETLGISGTVDGGAGRNIYGRVVTASGTRSLDETAGVTFQDRLIQVSGADTLAILTSTSTYTGTVYLIGDGAIDNRATVTGTVSAGLPYAATGLFGSTTTLAKFLNTGTITGQLGGSIGNVTNNGTVESRSAYVSAVSIYNQGALAFANSGRIARPVPTDPPPYDYYYYDYGYYQPASAVSLSGTNTVSVSNAGSVVGGLNVGASFISTETSNNVAISNSGSIASSGAMIAANIGVSGYDGGGTLSVVNSGSIVNAGGATFYPGYRSAYGLLLSLQGNSDLPLTFTIANRGTISADATATSATEQAYAYGLYIYGANASGAISNSGEIRATGQYATGIFYDGIALQLDNSGTIVGSDVVASDGSISGGGIASYGDTDDVVRNSGTVTGAILLGVGNDRLVNSGRIASTSSGPAILAYGTTSLDNSGTITGGTGAVAVQFGASDDTVTLRTGSSVTGAIVGGGGTDAAVLAGTSNAATTTQTLARFTGFDSLTVSSGYWTAAATASAFNRATIASGASFEVANGATGFAGLVVPSITDNGTLVVRSSSAPASSTFGATTVTGTGGVLFTGAGTVTLDGVNSLTNTGTNTVAGGTTLLLTGTQGGTFATASDGTFQIGNGGTSGTFTGSLANNGTLLLHRSDDYVLNGAITGAGTLTKQGAGKVTFGTGFAFTGTTNIVAGSIKLSTPVAATTELDVRGSGQLELSGTTQVVAELAGNSTTASVNIAGGSLTVNQSTSTSFAGNLTGAGSLVKTGSGRLNLTGIDTYTGPTSVNGGTLSINGSIVSPTTVNTGGTLGGTGTTGSVMIGAGGAFAPGNSVGTINVAGTVGFAAGSTFAVEANAIAADRIVATGAGTISGGTVAVTPDLSLAAFGKTTTYNILTASAVTGTFTSVTSSNASLLPVLSYTATGVNLTLANAALSFGAIAVGANQLAVANAVQARGFGNAVFNAVLIQPTALAGQAAFDNLSGELFASVPSILMDEGKRVRGAVMDRAAVRGDGAGVWAAGLVNNARSDVQGSAASTDTDRKGVVSGLDYGRSGWRVGVGAGYVKSDIDIAARASHADVETKLVTAYGGMSYGKLNLNLAATYSWHDIDTRRAITVGAVAGTATSSYKAKTFQFTEEASYALIDTGAFQASPFVGIGLIRNHSDAVAETGTAAALGVAASSRKVGFGTGGLRMGGNARVSDGVALLPHMSLSYTHAWGELTGTSLAAFGGTGTTFRTTGAVLGRNTMTADGGLDLAFGNNFRIGAGAYASTDKKWDDFGAKVTLGFNF